MRIYLIILFITIACLSLFAESKAQLFPVPKRPYKPLRGYECHYAKGEIVIDGLLNEKSWKDCFWSSPFVDIVSDSMPKPRYETKIKMLRDNDFFYIGAEMEEPDLWATLTQRDAVIFHDNDFEVFIDPDGDTHNYYELEINALNTVWDLMLLKPYRDGDKVAVNSWDIKGLKTAVHLNGTLNNPNDKDQGWTVEIAIPWVSLCELQHNTPPQFFEEWRINFSRVEWKHNVKNGKYVKATDTKGNPLPEDNWVWSQQGLVNMHYPEMWGNVKFLMPEYVIQDYAEWYFVDPVIKNHLRLIYYAEKEFYLENHKYNPSPIVDIRSVYTKSLDDYFKITNPPVIETTSRTYIAHISFKGDYLGEKRTWYINNEGKIWLEITK